MMMNTILMLADASAKCKCPPHAIAALAGTFAVGMLAGYFLGRRARADKAQQQPKRVRAAAAPSRADGKPRGAPDMSTSQRRSANGWSLRSRRAFPCPCVRRMM